MEVATLRPQKLQENPFQTADALCRPDPQQAAPAKDRYQIVLSWLWWGLIYLAHTHRIRKLLLNTHTHRRKGSSFCVHTSKTASAGWTSHNRPLVQEEKQDIPRSPRSKPIGWFSGRVLAGMVVALSPFKGQKENTHLPAGCCCGVLDQQVYQALVDSVRVRVGERGRFMGDLLIHRVLAVD